MSNERRKDSVGPATDVLEGDVGDVEACLIIYRLAIRYSGCPIV